MYIVTSQFSKLSEDVRGFTSLAEAEQYKEKLLKTVAYNYVDISIIDPYVYLLLKMECNK